MKVVLDSLLDAEGIAMIDLYHITIENPVAIENGPVLSTGIYLLCNTMPWFAKTKVRMSKVLSNVNCGPDKLVYSFRTGTLKAIPLF